MAELEENISIDDSELVDCLELSQSQETGEMIVIKDQVSANEISESELGAELKRLSE